MPKNNFDIAVKNLSKYKNKLIEIEKVKDIVEKILDNEYSENKAYKMIYHLKNKGHLLNLKKGIFLVKNPEKEYQEQQLLEMFYRCIAKKHCKGLANNKRYIGGIKALELNITNFDIPEELLIINDNKQSLETVMFDKQVSFKTYENNGKSLFNFFKKHTKNTYVGKNVFPIANIELAILESLYNPSVVNKGYIEELIKKVIRKNKKTLDLNVFEEILKKNKHHSSINRLYKLSLSIDPELSENLKDIIKRYSYVL
ncbi:MAG TPA: hypothetical protein PLP73_02445 [Candidatus Absconditabacterales bacterium]|nr:hypothetical protein [Candidatus Absconditabacterales bacterium]HRU50370.1 hypothetical protein [Candidatus Absconditabacterales bacterium]